MKSDDSNFDFEYLNNPRCYRLYNEIKKNIKFYDQDPEIFCGQARKILEILINDVLCEMGLIDNCKDYKLHEKINLLEQKLPCELLNNNNLFFEMNNIRIIGNKYVHFNDFDESKKTKDAFTILIALQNVSEWYYYFKNNYHEIMKKSEKDEESGTSMFSILLGVFLAVILIAAILIGIRFIAIPAIGAFLTYLFFKK